jgi:hypothetical protein
LKVSTNNTAALPPARAAAIVSAALANRPGCARRQKLSWRQAGNARLADKPNNFSPSQAAPGSVLRRFSNHHQRPASAA